MPENLIPDRYSATASLLKGAMASYRKTLQDLRKQRDEDRAEEDMALLGAQGRKAQAKAAYSKSKQKAFDATLGTLAEEMGLGETEEDRERMGKVTMKVAAVAFAASRLGGAVTAYQATASELTKPMLSEVARTSMSRTFPGQNLDDPATAQTVLEGFIKDNPNFIAEHTTYAATTNQSPLAAFQESFLGWLDTPGAVYTLTSLKQVKKLALQGKKTYDIIDKLKKLKEDFKTSAMTMEVKQACGALVSAIDGDLAQAAGKINPVAGARLAGIYEGCVAADSLEDLALGGDKPDAKGIIDTMAEGFIEALVQCDPTNQAFERVGRGIAAAFRQGAKADVVASAITETPADPFPSLKKAAQAAIAKAMNLPGADGKTEQAEDAVAADELAKALRDPAAVEAIRRNLADAEAAEMTRAWEDAQGENEEFEQILVLVDEGGIAMAEQRSIENLTVQLKKDRLILELVASLGKNVMALGKSASAISKTVADQSVSGMAQFGQTDFALEQTAEQAASQIVGQVAAGLRAARLVAQLAVNAIKAAERWKLWYEFKNLVERTRTARHALLPAIQNFYENKQEQCAYHTIEDAMLVIQLAGSIMETVPEPMTMAAGKVVTFTGLAAEKANAAGFAIYGENRLRAAWQTTRNAMNNPANRKAGLQALHENPTLAMHAIAFAAMNDDRMARSILDACGLDEQTLAHHERDPGAERKIAQYLETLLEEDRQLKDPDKIRQDWYPSTIALTRESWIKARHRAKTKATPQLSDSDNSATIEAALKLVEAQPSIEELTQDEQLYKPSDFQEFVKQAEALAAALKAYTPRAPDFTPHDQMKALADRFQDEALQRVILLKRVREEKQKRAPVRLGNRGQ